MSDGNGYSSSESILAHNFEIVPVKRSEICRLSNVGSVHRIEVD